MRPSRERDFRKEERELNNIIEVVKEGKDKTGLTFRPVELTDETRTRGGRRSRRRTARVWRPREINWPETD